MTEPLEAYTAHFQNAMSVVEDVLEATVDLSELQERALDLLTEWETLEVLRYLAGPPISADDLMTVSEARLSKAWLQKNPDAARVVVETVQLGLDRNRFPWVSEDREPTEAERSAASVATAALIAARKTMTARANDGKNLQEQKVKDALTASGYTEVPTRRIATLADAPNLGEFCGESDFGGRKADVVVRLWDNRVMPLECKVSGSATNSVKRLNNDAAVKAVSWISKFGTAQTVPSAMLAGVFKTKNLQSAQSDGLTLWWSHDLQTMTDWIETTR